MNVDVTTLTTRQEVFDYVVANLLKQNEQSVDDGSCLYRGPRGLKCAVGWLLTDEEAEGLDTIGGPTSVDVLFKEGLFPERFKKYGIDFLQRLQQIHDDYCTENWAISFNRFAEYRNLEFKPELYKEDIPQCLV